MPSLMTQCPDEPMKKSEASTGPRQMTAPASVPAKSFINAEPAAGFWGSPHPESQAKKILPTAAVAPASSPLALDDWVFLNAGDPVIVQTSEGRTVSGSIDIVADDASIFWIWVDGGGGRIAVQEEDRSRVWRVL
jgi:hypothetical protein